MVKAIKGHIHNGQIVLNEPIELPEGLVVEILLPEYEVTSDESDELEDELAESAAEFARGEFEDARAFAHGLVNREGIPVQTRRSGG
jgi:hypothetical protein